MLSNENLYLIGFCVNDIWLNKERIFRNEQDVWVGDIENVSEGNLIAINIKRPNCLHPAFYHKWH
jgi:hypothetical protein